MLPLHQVVMSGNDYERLWQLLQRGESVNAIDDRHNTPLHIVACKRRKTAQEEEDSIPMACALIYSGAEINKKNKCGCTPLLLAVISENRRMVEFLLEEKADVDAADNFGYTPLHFAIKAPYNLSDHPVWDEYYATRKPVLEMVKTILRSKPNLDARNFRNETPVLLAARCQDFPVLEELLERKASVSCWDRSGQCPMYHAVNRPSINLDMVMELLKHCAEFYRPITTGCTPMECYLRRLVDAPIAEIEKAKSVFRGFLLGKESLTPNHQRKIEELSGLKRVDLAQFIVRLRNEIINMMRDELATNCSVLNMAQRGFFFTTEKEKDQYSHVFDVLMNKLKNSEYPLYHDIIVCGISRSHLKKQFAEACVMVRSTGRAFLDNDTSPFACSYLSHLAMFNCIVAFSVC